MLGLLVEPPLNLDIHFNTELSLRSSAVRVDHFSSKEEICQTKLYLCHFALNTSLVPFHFFQPKNGTKFSFNVILYKLNSYTPTYTIQFYKNVPQILSVLSKLLYLRSSVKVRQITATEMS